MAGHEMTKPEAPAYVLVILPDQHITLTEVLRHVEAGRIVLIIAAPNATDIKAKPKQDRS
jgi:hypothetical protein